MLGVSFSFSQPALNPILQGFFINGAVLVK